jgi:hypothetical protein
VCFGVDRGRRPVSLTAACHAACAVIGSLGQRIHVIGGRGRVGGGGIGDE